MLLILVALELLGGAALLVALVVGLLTAPAASLATALALLVVVAIAVVALAAVLRGIWRGSAWVRAVAVVFQVLIAAIGIGAFQGAFAQPAWGWPLVIAGAAGFVLLVSKPVARWLSGPGPAA